MHAALHSGIWKGNSRDPQFGQNIFTVRDLGNVNVKRNFTATGLETGCKNLGKDAKCRKKTPIFGIAMNRSSGCRILVKKKRVQDPALQTLYIGVR